MRLLCGNGDVACNGFAKLLNVAAAVLVPQMQEQSVAGEITSANDEEELWL